MISSVFFLLFLFLNPSAVLGDFFIEKTAFGTNPGRRDFYADELNNRLNIFVYTAFPRTQKNAHRLPLSIFMIKKKSLTHLGKFRLTFPTSLTELSAQGLHLSLSGKDFHLNIYNGFLDTEEKKMPLEMLCREAVNSDWSYGLSLSKHTVNEKALIATSYYLYQDTPDPEPKDPEFFALCFRNADGRFTNLVFDHSFSPVEKDFLIKHLMIF